MLTYNKIRLRISTQTKAQRLELGLGRAEAAKAWGVGVNMLRRIEETGANVRLGLLFRIWLQDEDAKALNLLIGSNLRRRRLLMGVALSDLARGGAISQSILSKIERGKPVTLKTLCRVAPLYGADAIKLLSLGQDTRAEPKLGKSLAMALSEPATQGRQPLVEAVRDTMERHGVDFMDVAHRTQLSQGAVRSLAGEYDADPNPHTTSVERFFGAYGHCATGSERGAMLKQLRKARGLTQQDLAELAGYSPKVISRVEVGRHQPSWFTWVDLVSALGADPLIGFLYASYILSPEEVATTLLPKS